MSDDHHKENLYSVIALMLMVISIVVGGIFYFSMKDTLQAVDVDDVVKVAPTGTPKLKPDVPQLDFSTMKIAIPNEATGILVNSQGLQTGSEDALILNDIPMSEYTPDKVAGTVTWIILNEPAAGTYMLNVTGISDKAIAVYVKNTVGNEALELIDISDPTPGVRSFNVAIDPTSTANPIVISQK